MEMLTHPVLTTPGLASIATSLPSADVVAMIERLIAFNTVSRESNLGLIEWARDYLHSHGASTRLTYDATGRKANLFATIGAGSRPGLVLSGHTDVVPVTGQAWDTDPFVATIADGRIYGRGSADMKSYLAVILSMAPQFAAADGDAPFHYALSYDEEIGCIGVRSLIADLAENGIRPAGCIVGEPTMMAPVIAHKGKRDYHCHVRGRESHSAMTTHGVNAIEYAARLIVHIRQIADRMRDQEARQYGYPVPYTTLQTGVVKGGIATNVVPRDCEFGFEFRYLPGTDPDAMYDEIHAYAQSMLPEMRATAPEADIQFDMRATTPGLDAHEEEAIVKLAIALSRNANTQKVAYGTEAGLFQQAGIPTVICGPGSIDVAHRPNEYVEMAQVAQCQAFMQRLLEKLPLS